MEAAVFGTHHAITQVGHIQPLFPGESGQSVDPYVIGVGPAEAVFAPDLVAVDAVIGRGYAGNHRGASGAGGTAHLWAQRGQLGARIGQAVQVRQVLAIVFKMIGADTVDHDHNKFAHNAASGCLKLDAARLGMGCVKKMIKNGNMREFFRVLD